MSFSEPDVPRSGRNAGKFEFSEEVVVLGHSALTLVNLKETSGRI